MATVPRVGAARPRIIFMVVDFPAPLGPRNPVTWPGSTVNDRSSTTVSGPYRLVSPRIAITVMAAILAARAGRVLGTSGRTL